MRLLYLVTIISFVNSFAQQRVEGNVYDVRTSKTIENVNIQIKPTDNRGTSTDANGRFSIELLSNNDYIELTHIGYDTLIIDTRTLAASENKPLNISMIPIVIQGEQISIDAHPEDKGDKDFTVSSTDVSYSVAPTPDALLVLQTLPGVGSLNDQSTFYNVRGGNYDENLIYVNGLEIVQPLLVRKGIAENPSLVNPDLVSSINLRTAAIPVSFGDKLSSVADISYYTNYEKKIEWKVGFSPIKNTLAAFGPVNDKISFLFGARKIDYGNLFQEFQTQGDYSPNFTDFQGGISYKITPFQKIEIFGIHAKSLFQLAPEDWHSGTLKPSTNEITSMAFDGNESFEHWTNTAGLNWSLQKEKFGINAGISTYQQGEKELVDLEYYAKVALPTFQDSIYYANKVYDIAAGEQRDNKLDLKLNRFRLNGTYKFNWQHKISTGFELKSYNFSDDLVETLFDSKNSVLYEADKSNYKSSWDSNGASWFANYMWKPTTRFVLSVGTRVTTSNTNKENLVLPRLSAQYRISNSGVVRFALGKYAQFPLYKEYDPRALCPKSELLSQKATQYLLGYNKTLKNNTNIRIEAFYKNLQDIISYEVFDVNLDYSGMNDAKGYAYGAEAFIKGEFVPKTVSWISYSYLVAREKLIWEDNYYPRPTDQRHNFSAMLQDKMDRLPWSKLHIRVRFGTGYPYTRRLLRVDENGQKIVTVGEKGAARLGYYLRYDIGFTQEFSFLNYKLSLREEILNLFDRSNMLGYSWINGASINHFLSGRTFNIGVSIQAD